MNLPEGYHSKEEYVHDLFASIAKKYDLMNSILSFKQDQCWRNFAVQETGLKSGGRGLDVCCGTGMFALAQARVVGLEGKVVGIDFCEEMLAVARRNLQKSTYGKNVELVWGNAMELPFKDNSFDCATIGFALRNVPDIQKTITEMTRVVRPGGRVVSLELAKPSFPIFKQVYYLYFDRLVPLMGRIGVGKFGPYNYLPNSLKVFPHQEEVRKIFATVGLDDAHYHELTGGIVAVHVGTKK